MSPSVVPMVRAMPTATTPVVSDTRAPKRTRERRSRPIASVPSGNRELGGSSAASRNTRSGSYGARRSARSAASANSAMTASATRTCGRRSRGSRIADTRIHERVQKIDDDVHEHVRGRDQQHHSLHEREVALKDRLHGESPDARAREDAIDDDRPREQPAELEADDRDHWDEARAEDVADEHHALRQPLRV